MYRPNQPQLYNARMPLVSMLLPVHNASATLGAALDSLLAGPLHNRERVIMWGAGQMARCLAKHLQRAGGGIFGSEPAKVRNATARRTSIAHDNSACCMQPTRSS